MIILWFQVSKVIVMISMMEMRGPIYMPKIYAFFLGNIDNFGNLTGVKDLTNATSVFEVRIESSCI